MAKRFIRWTINSASIVAIALVSLFITTMLGCRTEIRSSGIGGDDSGIEYHPHDEELPHVAHSLESLEKQAEKR